ncbi:uncharacterized protein LOC135842914 [Planococcus citri]|uniref:uncharacterized protein LOC135842914 n=1 Tax=Planococcus citri TaxID=170843 RepID=UPI0031F8022F
MNFRIIICVYVLTYWNKCLGIVTTSSEFENEKTEKTSFTQNLEEVCLREIKCPNAKVEDLEAGDLIRFVECMKRKYDEVKSKAEEMKSMAEENIEAKFYYQSLFDVTERIEQFFAECWPRWAGARSKENHSKEAWEVLMLNSENPAILRLKTVLHQNEVSDEKFIHSVMLFEAGRNKEAHAVLLDPKREEAYKHLKKRLASTNQTESLIALDALIQAVDFMSQFSKTLPIQSSVLETIEKDVEEKRVSYRVLNIKNFPLFVRPKIMRVNIQGLIRDCPKQPGEQIKFPIMIFFSPTDILLVFRSFKEAYSIREMFMKRFKMQDADLIIMNIFKEPRLRAFSYIRVIPTNQGATAHLAVGLLNSAVRFKVKNNNAVIYCYLARCFDTITLDYDFLMRNLTGYHIDLLTEVKGLNNADYVDINDLQSIEYST